jgi:hypothetical protein
MKINDFISSMDHLRELSLKTSEFNKILESQIKIIEEEKAMKIQAFKRSFIVKAIFWVKLDLIILLILKKTKGIQS